MTRSSLKIIQYNLLLGILCFGLLAMIGVLRLAHQLDARQTHLVLQHEGCLYLADHGIQTTPYHPEQSKACQTNVIFMPSFSGRGGTIYLEPDFNTRLLVSDSILISNEPINVNHWLPMHWETFYWLSVFLIAALLLTIACVFVNSRLKKSSALRR